MKWMKERMENREKRGKKGERREGVGKRTGRNKSDRELGSVLQFVGV